MDEKHQRSRAIDRSEILKLQADNDALKFKM